MTKLLFATSNPNKLREVAEIFAPFGITLTSLGELDRSVAEPEETGQTFADNARDKALSYARAVGRPCLAEDSGLEVPALDGAPGVYSARYAGTRGTRAERDQANNAKLLAAVAALEEPDRAARFVCAMCVALPTGAIVAEAAGSCGGVITLEPRGTNGFGYDPLFYLPDLGRTSAELSPAEKNARSHRGRAARQLAEMIARDPGLLEQR